MRLSTLMLQDANQAVLGSLTTHGAGGSSGTLSATNGVLINFGRNIAGFGTVDTPNDPLRPTIVNGAVVGDSIASPITMAGWIGGVATYDNVVFSGTFDSGFSPSTVAMGKGAFDGNLIIELGGQTPGSDFDLFSASGDITLAGNLTVQLMNSFALGPNMEFAFIDANGLLAGQFICLSEGGLVGNFGGTNLFISYNAGDGNDVELFTPIVKPRPGDFDNDGDVDGADFLKWQWGESPNPLSQSDLATWQANFGTVAPLIATGKVC